MDFLGDLGAKFGPLQIAIIVIVVIGYFVISARMKR